ncbi:MAG: hypothetical protein ACE5KC_02460 [Candidatus Bathyarchaeia archaeon]
MREAEKNFDKLFMEAVDESLTVLPKSGREMLFFHLERGFSIERNNIPKKPEIFIAALEQIFGAGALVLQKLIVKNLYSKLGLEYREREGYTIVDYLKCATVDHPKPRKGNDNKRPDSHDHHSHAITYTGAFQQHDSPFTETL